MNFPVFDNQTLFDIVLQKTGDIENLYAIMQANNLGNISPTIQNINIDFISNETTSFYVQNKFDVACKPDLYVIDDFLDSDFLPNDFS